MRKNIVFLFVILFLLGCASKESRTFIRDEQNKEMIYEEIVRQGKETYHLEVEPNVNKMKFGWDTGFPLLNDSRIVVPVQTVEEPEFSFDAVVFISGDPLEITNINIDNAPQAGLGLGDLGEYLVRHIYTEKYQEAFDQLKTFDQHVSIETIFINALTSYYFEEEEEKIALYQAISADYNQGKFNDPAYYDQLLESYVPQQDSFTEERYYPRISLHVKQPNRSEFDIEERIALIIKYIQASDILPSATYSIVGTDNKDERIYESFTKEYEKKQKSF